MKKIATYLIIALFFSRFVSAQILIIDPGGANKKASVTENIGITKIVVDYNRPGVKGREGKIWGTNVAHYGQKNMGFGVENAPWRAGANENTVISFSEDVKVEGKELPAGTYGLFIILGELESTIIFSKNSTSWGSFYYSEAEDALRVTVKNRALNESVEWLKYEFIEQSKNTATVALMWEKRMIPFVVETDIVKTHLAYFRRELRSVIGFVYQPYVQAAQFCLDHNAELEQGLIWAETAISGQFVGTKNFQTLSLKASLLEALNRNRESEIVMKEAIVLGTMAEVHQYARSLQAKGKYQQAFEVYKFNHSKNPTEFMTLVGLGRGYSSLGNYKEALKYMKQALPKVPNETSKLSVEGMIKKLQEGKDINL